MSAAKRRQAMNTAKMAEYLSFMEVQKYVDLEVHDIITSKVLGEGITRASPD